MHSGSCRANRATKRSFRARTVSLSIRTPQPPVTGRFGHISRFDLSDTQRVASVPTVVSAFSRRPFTRTHQTLFLGCFSQIIYLCQSLIKVYIAFVYLPTYTLPPIYFHPPTDLPPPTHPPTYYPPTYLHPPTHPPDNLPPPTYIHQTTIYLPTYHHPNTHPPTYLYPPYSSHSPSYIPTYLSTNPTHFSSPTYPPTCLHTTYHLPI